MMTQLTLAIPSLFWPHTETALPVLNTPGLDGLRHWGHWHASAMCTSAFYGRYLWTQPPVDTARQQLGLAAEETCFLCSPISQRIGMHQASFIEGADLALDCGTAAAFCTVLNEFFHDDGGHFLPWQTARWVVHTPQPLSWSAPALLDLAGVIDGTSRPQGKDATAVLQWQTEIQMLLYQHPLNQARQQQGLPPINGVWLESTLSGTAAMPPVLLNTDTWALPPSAYHMADTMDGLGTACSEADQADHQILFFSALRTPVNQGDVFTYQRLLQTMDQHWFTPLLHALQQKRLQQLTIVTDGEQGGSLTVRKPRITPFWRSTTRFNGIAS